MITVNQPMIDFVTLTTWEQHLWAKARHNWLSLKPGGKQQKRMQYGGVNYDGVFFGIGEQRGKPHYMVQSSGEPADSVIALLPVEAMNCTRIDLQVTIPKPPDFCARTLYDLLKVWDRPGPARQVSIIQSGEGYDTVYIGNRQSDRFTRVYVKPTETAGDLVRYEVEYKGDHARTVFSYVLGGGDTIGDVLLQEMAHDTSDENSVMPRFWECCGGNPYKPPIKRVNGENTTLEWLSGQVTASIIRLLNAHDTHDRMVDLIDHWHAMC